jgi:hypothetical protein
MRAPRNRLVSFISAAIFIGICLAGAFLAYVFYAAGTAVPTRPLVGISETIPASPAVAGQPVVVFAQASDPDGIVEVTLWVNGQQAGSQANPGQSTFPFESSQAWIPKRGGSYLVVLKATDRKGFAGASAPLIIRVQERKYEPDPDLQVEYLVQAGDTLESIAASFGLPPDELRALNPGLGELIPGASLRVPPHPAGETGADAPPDSGEASLPHVDPPLPAPAPGGETDTEPAADDWLIGWHLPFDFSCFTRPASCARAIDLEPAPFPAPGGVGFVGGDECGIDVSWTDNSENESGFRIYRFASRPRFRMDLLEIVRQAPGSGTRLHFRDAHPPRGSFFYAVAAYNAGGDTWSGPSAPLESIGCPPPAGAEQALVVEGLALTVTESFERLYCYASLAGSPFERVPQGAGNFITLESGAWDIAEHFSGVNKREVLAPGAGPLDIVVECLGWRGEELVNLGRFARAHLPEEWDGRPLTAGPDSGSFNVTYRIQPSFRAADEGGRATWPLIDARLPAPFNLHTTEDLSDCRRPPDRRSPGDPCQKTVLVWDYTAAGAAPLAYQVYRRSSESSVPVLYHAASIRSAPLVETDCNETISYSVSAVVGNDPVTGEAIQSPLSEEFEVPPTCGTLEITLESLWVYGVYDGDGCYVFTDCAGDYEAYGWLSFNGQRVRWNDHCDSGFFDLGGCVYVGPSYSEVNEASGHDWASFMLNNGDGWRRGNNVIRIPIADGQDLRFTFTLIDHDSSSEDDLWCGGTGRPLLTVPGRPASAWQTADEEFAYDSVVTGSGECIIRFRVRGMP